MKIELKVDARTGLYVAFHIEEQDFNYCINYKASNGVELKSMVAPEWQEITKVLFVRGCNEQLNKKMLICKEDDFYMIEQAIEEFNKKGVRSKEQNSKMFIRLINVATTKKNVVFRIEDQNFRDMGMPCFKASNGIRIICAAYPDWSSPDNELYVRGRVKANDDNEMVVTAEDYTEICFAVDEFNEKYKTHGVYVDDIRVLLEELEDASDSLTDLANTIENIRERMEKCLSS